MGPGRGAKLWGSYGRIADDLRISVTDRCNFRCVYCMPAEGLKWLAREDILRFEEIHRLARLFVQRYGVRTIRLTGGEPLVRHRLEELVAMINDLDATLDITMTTNGVLLREKAKLLAEAGLKRINISLDTLHIDRFREIARVEAFARTMDGIRAAEAAGLRPIKLNMVVMKGTNDDEVTDFAHEVKACALGQASSSIMARNVIGAKADELRALRDTVRRMLKENGTPPDGKWADIAVLEPVRDYKARHASTMLTFDAVVDAINQIEAKRREAVAAT